MAIPSSLILIGSGLMIIITRPAGSRIRNLGHWLRLWFTIGLILGLFAFPAAAAVIGQDDQTVAVGAEPAMAALTEGLVSGNYTLYSQYNDTSGKEVNPKERFNLLRNYLGRRGAMWDSYLYQGFLNTQDTTIVFYKIHLPKSNLDRSLSLILSKRGEQIVVVGCEGDL